MVRKQSPSTAVARSKSTLRSDPPTVLRQIGDRIRALRVSKGYSQDRLAYAIPLDRAHIGSIERGIKAPTVITLLRIADTLQVEVGELFPLMADLRDGIPRKDIYGMASQARTEVLSTRIHEPKKMYRATRKL